MSNTAGERIRLFRKRKNWTQKQLGDLMGTSKQTIMAWEANRTFPKPEHRGELMRLFEAGVDDLFPELSVNFLKAAPNKIAYTRA